MGKYVIDISERFLAGFGFLAKNIAPRLLKVGYNGKFIYGNIDVYSESSRTFDELYLSGNGFNIKFGAMPFLSGNFGLLSDVISKDQVTDNVFAPPPMISFSRSKNIKTTEITNSDVEVVENFGNKSWSIKIQGILVDMENHLYPSKWVKTLNKVFEINKPYEVASNIFADHGIEWIYFTNIDSSGIQGYEDTWKFTLTARSIKPVEFELKNQ
jgi:hypothetical protein